MLIMRILTNPAFWFDAVNSEDKLAMVLDGEFSIGGGRRGGGGDHPGLAKKDIGDGAEVNLKTMML